MDWQEPGKEKVILAVMKLPAKNQTGAVFSLFTNPGVSLTEPLRNWHNN